jgi:hypothetical protein
MHVAVKAALITVTGTLAAAIIYVVFQHSSPTVQLSTVHSPGSIQAGGDIKDVKVDNSVHNGVPPETLEHVLDLKETEVLEQMLAQFPYGGIVVGLPNGSIMMKSKLKIIEVKLEPDDITFFVKNGIGHLSIAKFSITNPESNNTLQDISVKNEGFPFIRTSNPIDCGVYGHMLGIPNMYISVLDVDKEIFILGFK